MSNIKYISPILISKMNIELEKFYTDLDRVHALKMKYEHAELNINQPSYKILDKRKKLDKIMYRSNEKILRNTLKNLKKIFDNYNSEFK